MAQWEGTKVASTFDATSYTKNMIDSRSQSGNMSINTGAIPQSIGAGEYDVIGIKGSAVEPTIEAIQAYIMRVRQLQAQNTESMRAFKDSLFDEQMKSAFDNYMIKFDGYVQNLVSQLSAFNDKLRDIKSAWESSVNSMASSIEADASSFNSGSEYTQSR
jgi:hypothetical protein